MTLHSKTIALNDRLRTTFNGGRVRVEPSRYQLDDRLCGRALYVMSRQWRFDAESNHDLGRFVFAGYLFEWSIDQESKAGGAPPAAGFADSTPVLTLRVLDDRLMHSPTTSVTDNRPVYR